MKPGRTDEERAARALASRARRQRKRNGKTGPHDHVPAGPAELLLRQAFEAGITLSLITSEAGVERKTISDIAAGRRDWIRASTEWAVECGVERAWKRWREGDVSPTRVSVDESRTMLRRLGAAGWSLPTLVREHGLPENVGRERATYIRPEDAEKVRAIYNQIDGQLGPSVQTARFWRGRGYIVPAAETEYDQLELPARVRDQRGGTTPAS